MSFNTSILSHATPLSDTVAKDFPKLSFALNYMSECEIIMDEKSEISRLFVGALYDPNYQMDLRFDVDAFFNSKTEIESSLQKFFPHTKSARFFQSKRLTRAELLQVLSGFKNSGLVEESVHTRLVAEIEFFHYLKTGFFCDYPHIDDHWNAIPAELREFEEISKFYKSCL